MLALLLGGVVKGTLGIGLPLVALPLLSLIMPATQAMVLMLAPVLVSNIWQLRQAGISRAGAQRFMPLIGAQVVLTAITVPLTLALPDATVRRALAIALLIGVLLIALPLRLQVPPRQERWWSLLVGASAGLMGGVSSLTGPVIVSYLVSLRLSREIFVGSISLIYLSSALTLYGSMALQGRVGTVDLLRTTAALLPMALGLAVGRRIRLRLAEVWFRRVLLVFLASLALMLLVRA